jgi:hypothetical protein
MRVQAILCAVILAASVPARGADAAGTAARAAGSQGAQEGCLAQNVYFEARGEPTDGMVAVGWVALNRAARTGNTPCGVVHQRVGGRCQFDWACRSHAEPSGEPWDRSRAVARALGGVPDPTGGATYFAVCGKRLPGGLTMTRHIGRHCFWREGPGRALIADATYRLVPDGGAGWRLAGDVAPGAAPIGDASTCPVPRRRPHRAPVESFLEVAEAR